MMNVSGSTDSISLSSEQAVSIVNKLFDNFPKSSVELQLIIKSINYDEHIVEAEIPLEDKTVALTLKLPENISLYDKVTLNVDFEDKTVTLNVDGYPKLTNLTIKLNDSSSALTNEDFKLQSIRIDAEPTNLIFDNEDALKTFPLKPVEILSPYMAGKNFEAYVLKDIPVQNKIDLGIPLESNSPLINTEAKIPYNTKLMVEIIKIYPPMIEDSIVVGGSDILNVPLIKLDGGDNQVNNTLPLPKDGAVVKSDNPLPLTGKVDENLVSNPKMAETTLANPNISPSELDKLITDTKQGLQTLPNTATPDGFLSPNATPSKDLVALDYLAQKTLGQNHIEIPTYEVSAKDIEKQNLLIKGIVISKPSDTSQKILLSDVGVITLPELKEKLPFKSVIDLKIKDIVSFERIFEEFAVSNNEPYNSVEKIISHLHKMPEAKPVLEEFIKELPKFDNHILHKIEKYVTAIKHKDFSSIFTPELLDKIDDLMPNKEFLTKMLKEDFTKPLNINIPNQTNNFSLYILPLFNDDTISKMWLYMFTPQIIRDEENEKNGKKPQVKQRFLLDLTLSELGNMQFEGFVDEPNRKLDLMVKSLEDFSDTEKNDMNQIFFNSMQTLDYIGEIKFRKMKEMVKPFEQVQRKGYFI